MATKSAHGGIRPGAGRKPSGKKVVSLYFPPDVVAYLETLTDKSVTVVAAVRASKGFKTFQTNLSAGP